MLLAIVLTAHSLSLVLAFDCLEPCHRAGDSAGNGESVTVRSPATAARPPRTFILSILYETRMTSALDSYGILQLGWAGAAVDSERRGAKQNTRDIAESSSCQQPPGGLWWTPLHREQCAHIRAPT